MKEVNVNNILYANNIFELKKNELIDYYIEEYGEEYQKIIINNINNTIYIFDSTPDITYQFIRNNSDKINNQKLISQKEKEYLNYIKAKTRIDNKLINEFNNRVSIYLNKEIYGRGYWDLDLECYNLELNKILNYPDTLEEAKIDILNRRKNYLNMCKLLKLEPIISWEVISSLLFYKEKMLQREHEYLIKNTIWGRNILKRILLENKQLINISTLANTIFSTNPGKTDYHFKRNKPVYKICFVPIIRNLEYKNSDRVLLHELRHVVESRDLKCGLSVFDNGKYNMLNEVNTQMNAIKDENSIAEIFSKDTETLKTTYDLLMPYASDFLEENKPTINRCAIHSNPYLIEEYFDRLSLEELDLYLNRIHEKLIKCIDLDKIDV